MNESRILAGRYRLEHQLGSGGTAVVHRAFDLTNLRPVAVKELRPQFAQLGPARRRFLREAAIGRWLTNPGIVAILDSGEERDSVFLVMELVEGETLRQLLQRVGPLGPRGARRIVGRLSEVVGYAHKQGVVHRDLKPENIFVLGTPYRDADEIIADDNLYERLKIGDFGQARVAALASLTGTSMTWGTPEYMAPEMFARGPADPRSDLYTLGIILHELVTGRLPWPRADALARLGAMAMGKTVQPPTLAGDGPLNEIMAVLLEPNPAARPETAFAVCERLSMPTRLVAKNQGDCLACGAALEKDLPLCLACGHQAKRFAHTPDGRCRLILRSLDDDADIIARLLRLLTNIAPREWRGPPTFLTEGRHMYSKEERQASIGLPAVLFTQLDEPTALDLERLFRNHGLDVIATGIAKNSRAKIPRKRLRVAGELPVAVVGSSLVLSFLVHVSHSWQFSLPATATVMGLFGVGRWVNGQLKLRTEQGRFRLNDSVVAVPVADAILAEAAVAVGRLRLPDARSLLIDLSRSLYRLTHQIGAGSSTPAASRSTFLEAVPEIARRITAMATRLEVLDHGLAESREADLIQGIARLERRIAVVDAADRERLLRTRQQLERSLSLRQEVEDARDDLTNTLCQLLGRLRTAAMAAQALSAQQTAAGTNDGTGQDDALVRSSLQELERYLREAEDLGSAAAAKRLEATVRAAR